MRTVYTTLQKLRDQEKREKLFNMRKQNKVVTEKSRCVNSIVKLEEERQVQVESMGMRVLQDYLEYAFRHIDIKRQNKSFKKHLLSLKKQLEMIDSTTERQSNVKSD